VPAAINLARLRQMAWFQNFFSACAQLTYLVSKRRRGRGWALARDLTVAGAAALFSMWVNFATGYQAVYQALVAVFVGIAVLVTARGEDAGQIPEPADNPPDVSTAPARPT
jgi:basic amino acid/polyamine antiporter, APA family